MLDNESITLWASLWQWLGSSPVNSAITVIGSVITIALFALPFILKRFKQRSKNKPVRQQQNPYSTGNPVAPAKFLGRKQELRQFLTYLDAGESISLLGDRRIGKSSLLLRWQAYLIQQNTPVFLLDGQKQEGENLQAFLHALLQQTIPENISADDAANRLVQWAEKHYLEHAQKPVILVDECDRILRQCPHRFWERVRGALDKVVWVFSSKTPLDTLYRDGHSQGSPFENRLKTVWLGLLDQDAANALIKRGDFPAAQQQLLAQWAGCHAFYLQALASHLWLNRPNYPEVKVLDAYKMEARRHLDDLWGSLPAQDQQKLLQCVLTQQRVDDTALRSRGVITSRGKPFAAIFIAYLKDKIQRSC